MEAWLREPVRAHLEAEGYRVRQEVPLHGRIADFVGARGAELVAVELKLDDWREALAQAMHYQLAAHRAYMALPLNHAIVPLRARSRLERQGVGLLAVHPLGEVRTLLAARESSRRLPFLSHHTLARWFDAPAPGPGPHAAQPSAAPAGAAGPLPAPNPPGHGHAPPLGLSNPSAVPAP